jgi:hypothetical protein
MNTLFTAEALARPCDAPMIEYALRRADGVSLVRGFQVGHFAVRPAIGTCSTPRGLKPMRGWNIEAWPVGVMFATCDSTERALCIADEANVNVPSLEPARNDAEYVQQVGHLRHWRDAVETAPAFIGYREWLKQNAGSAPP